MSRSVHPRKQARKRSSHNRNWKEWKGTSRWKKKERATVKTKPRTERRSPRKRSGDNGWPGNPPVARRSLSGRAPRLK